MEGNSTQAQTQTPIPVSQPPSAPQDTSPNNTKLIGIALVVILVLVVSVLGFLFYNEVTRGSRSEGDIVVVPTQSPSDFQNSTIDPNVVCARVKSIEIALKNIDKTCALDLSGQNLSALPDGVIGLSKLNQIILNDNNFTEIPAELYRMQNLIEIDISNNQISSISESIQELTNLQKINASGNKLASLPDSLFTLPYLNNLILTGNNFSEDARQELVNKYPQITFRFD